VTYDTIIFRVRAVLGFPCTTANAKYFVWKKTEELVYLETMCSLP